MEIANLVIAPAASTAAGLWLSLPQLTSTHQSRFCHPVCMCEASVGTLVVCVLYYAAHPPGHGARTNRTAGQAAALDLKMPPDHGPDPASLRTTLKQVLKSRPRPPGLSLTSNLPLGSTWEGAVPCCSTTARKSTTWRALASA